MGSVGHNVGTGVSQSVGVAGQVVMTSGHTVCMSGQTVGISGQKVEFTGHSGQEWSLGQQVGITPHMGISHHWLDPWGQNVGS